MTQATNFLGLSNQERQALADAIMAEMPAIFAKQHVTTEPDQGIMETLGKQIHNALKDTHRRVLAQELAENRMHDRLK